MSPASKQGATFVTCGPFSGTNESLLPLLEAAFPELQASRFDVASWLRGKRPVYAANLARTLLENNPLGLIGGARVYWAFYTTGYLQRRIDAAIRQRLAGTRQAFTLQTQSMFDASSRGTPHFVYTDHTALANTYYPGFDRKRLPSKRWLARERKIYEHATLTFTWSSHVSRSLVELYGIDPGRIRCVFAGTNVDSGTAVSTDDRSGKQILYVGRDWERKGGPLLLEAFKKVRRSDPDATLLVLGEDSPQLDVEGVTVLGEVSASEVGEQYLRSAVFCMPTRVEPFGIVFVEALAHGVPVVATPVGALPDIVQDGETGFLVAPDDPDQLAARLLTLLGDPDLRRRFGELGRERVLQRYTWPHVADAIAGHIRTALAES